VRRMLYTLNPGGVRWHDPGRMRSVRVAGSPARGWDARISGNPHVLARQGAGPRGNAATPREGRTRKTVSYAQQIALTH
jgi:hypothetical protein